MPALEGKIKVTGRSILKEQPVSEYLNYTKKADLGARSTTAGSNLRETAGVSQPWRIHRDVWRKDKRVLDGSVGIE